MQIAKLLWLCMGVVAFCGDLRSSQDVVVTGTTTGTVWGSGPYTSDSTLGKAAVHAGLIAIGQSATIRVESLGQQSSFVGSTAHGVTTLSYGYNWEAVSLSLVSGGNTPPKVTMLIPASVPTGGSFIIEVTATDIDADLNGHSLTWQGVGLLQSWSISGSSATHQVQISAAPSTPGTLYFRTEANDIAGNNIEGPWVAVQVTSGQNSAPQATVAAPSSVASSGIIATTATAFDIDGNLQSLKLKSNFADDIETWTVSGTNATKDSSPMAPSTGGTYLLAAVAKDLNGVSGESGWWSVAVSGAGPSLLASPMSAPIGGTLSVQYTGAYPGAWIGLFVSGDPSTNPIVSEPVTQSGNGTISFVLSPERFSSGIEYQARYFPGVGGNPSGWSNTFSIPTTSYYTLTVDSGTGSASGLAANTQVDIVAHPAPQGQSFWGWLMIEGNGVFNDFRSASTRFTLSNSNARISASYAGLTVSPNVVSSGGSIVVGYSGALSTGNRISLAQVGSADSSSIEQRYVPSVGNAGVTFTLSSSFVPGVNYEARLLLDSAAIVMARSAAFTVSAGSTYDVSVLGGSGDASGLPTGATIAISAAAPPIGQKFSHWSITSGSGSFTNAAAPVTDFLVGNASATVQANYVSAPYQDFSLVGRAEGGSVFGTDVYTSDSDTARAAVHAGLLANGQAGTVRVYQIGSWYEFIGSARNGVTSMSYSAFGAIQLQLLAVAPTFSLSVIGGTGSASGLPENTVVSIGATVPTGLTFSHWATHRRSWAAQQRISAECFVHHGGRQCEGFVDKGRYNTPTHSRDEPTWSTLSCVCQPKLEYCHRCLWDSWIRSFQERRL
jgi:hypothetical protein